MRGEKVIVRTYGSIPVVCKIWDTEMRPRGLRVLVCDDEIFDQMTRGLAPRDDCFPISFPEGEVFKFDDGQFDPLNTHIWGTLTPWQAPQLEAND